MVMLTLVNYNESGCDDYKWGLNMVLMVNCCEQQ